MHSLGIINREIIIRITKKERRYMFQEPTLTLSPKVIYQLFAGKEDYGPILSMA
jgi:hypothetical protein